VKKISLNKTTAFIALAFLVFSVYANSLFNRFVWDDGYLIVENPFIKHFKYFPNLFVGDLMHSTISRHIESGYYRPLSMFSFMADYHLWGLNPFGFHLTNVLIHFLNSIFVFLLIFEIAKNQKMAFLAAALFAVHPLHVEAVAPVYNRMGIQGTFFVLSALWLFIKSENFSNGKFLWGSLSLFILGLLSKEDTIVLPLIYLCYDYYYLSDFKWRSLWTKPKIKFYASCLLIWVLYFLVRQQNVQFQMPSLLGTAQYPALAGNVLFHVATVIQILGGYIFKALFPVNISPLYWIDPVERITDLGFIGGAGVVVLTAVALFLSSRKFKNISFAIALFFISILPFTNILPIAQSYVFFERFLYLPTVGLCFILAEMAFRFRERLYSDRGQRILSLFLIVAILGMGYTSVILNYNWRTDLSLWRWAVLKTPSSFQAHLNLAYAYMERGEYEKALSEFTGTMGKASVSRNQWLTADGVYLAKLNLGKIYTEFGRFDQAISEINQAVVIAGQARLNPYAAFDKLGLAYAQKGDQHLAQESFKKALASNENFVPSRYNLGVSYYQGKDYADAENQFKEALRLDPDFSLAAVGLGLIYAQQGQNDSAIAMFEKALKMNPGDNFARRYLFMLKERPSK